MARKILDFWTPLYLHKKMTIKINVIKAFSPCALGPLDKILHAVGDVWLYVHVEGVKSIR